MPRSPERSRDASTGPARQAGNSPRARSPGCGGRRTGTAALAVTGATHGPTGRRRSSRRPPSGGSSRVRTHLGRPGPSWSFHDPGREAQPAGERDRAVVAHGRDRLEAHRLALPRGLGERLVPRASQPPAAGVVAGRDLVRVPRAVRGDENPADSRGRRTPSSARATRQVRPNSSTSAAGCSAHRPRPPQQRARSASTWCGSVIRAGTISTGMPRSWRGTAPQDGGGQGKAAPRGGLRCPPHDAAVGEGERELPFSG